MKKPGNKGLLPYAEHLKRVPKKRTAAGVLFFNEKSELLMVKPTYKDHWILPGGVIEEFEGPEAAAIREVKEELNLDITQPIFIAGIHSPRRTQKDDVIHFYFLGKQLSLQQLQKISLQSDELIEYRFVPLVEISEISKASFVPHLKKILEAIQNKLPILVENKEGSVG